MWGEGGGQKREKNHLTSYMDGPLVLKIFLKVKAFKHACGALEDAEPCLALVEVAEVIAEVTEVNSLLQLIGHF